jgi:hypothetical protein
MILDLVFLSTVSIQKSCLISFVTRGFHLPTERIRQISSLFVIVPLFQFPKELKIFTKEVLLEEPETNKVAFPIPG